jgi:hypothetical protein
VVADGHGLSPLQVRVAGHGCLGFLFGAVEQDVQEGLDRRKRLVARVLDVQPQSGRDLVVARAPGMDLPADISERPLDQRVHVLLARLVFELAENVLGFSQLVVRKQPGGVQPACVNRCSPAVVGKQLRVVGREESLHLRDQFAVDTS